MEYLDLHSHLLRDMFKDNYDEVLKKTLDADSKIFNIGIDMKTSKECIELARSNPKQVKAVIGIHPSDVTDNFDIDILEIEKLYEDNKEFVMAIGEIGFNLFEDNDYDNQVDAFRKQIELALKLDLPIIIHSRNGHDQTYDLLKSFDKLPVTILHSWTGDVEITKKLMGLGCLFSFSGIVTFKNAKDIQKSLDIIPLEKIFYETDCPWLAPTPLRGKLNIPEYSKHVGMFIAERKEITFEELNNKIVDNFIRIFKNGEWINESK